jgi:leader peptidase (prepilin peptidase) / N-methyltransferase
VWSEPVSMIEFLALYLPVLWWAVVGATVASGTAAIAGRLRSGVSVMDRSRCVCGRPLGPSELIPVVSWVRVRGRSRCCDSAIPTQLVVGEMFGAVVAAAAVLLAGWPGGVVALGFTAALNAAPALRSR